MLLVKLDQSAGLIFSTGPAPWSLVSRTATRPGALATSTHCPPLPPLLLDLRQFSPFKVSPDRSHDCRRVSRRQRSRPKHPDNCNQVAYLLLVLDDPASPETLGVCHRRLP